MNFFESFKKPIVGLAPMDGITDWPMRQVQYSVAKPDLFYTEFIRVDGLVHNFPAFEKKLYFKNDQPLIIQLYGHKPELFYRAILAITDLGFCGIDINMGCPSPNVVSSGGGAALIGNLDLAEKIIKQSLLAINKSGRDLPLSIKTRIIADKKANRKWAKFLASFDLSLIAVHGRPIKQRHSGDILTSQLCEFNKIAKSKGLLFLANGGIKSRSQAEEFCLKFGFDGVLIGQAAIGNPWAFAKDSPAVSEVFATMLRHAQMVEKFYSVGKFNIIRKHLAAYCKGFNGAKSLRTKLVLADNAHQVKVLISDFAKKNKLVPTLLRKI